MNQIMQEVGIIIKSAHEIAIMREAGRIVAAVIEALTREVRPGVTTARVGRYRCSRA